MQNITDWFVVYDMLTDAFKIYLKKNSLRLHLTHLSQLDNIIQVTNYLLFHIVTCIQVQWIIEKEKCRTETWFHPLVKMLLCSMHIMFRIINLENR